MRKCAYVRHKNPEKMQCRLDGSCSRILRIGGSPMLISSSYRNRSRLKNKTERSRSTGAGAGTRLSAGHLAAKQNHQQKLEGMENGIICQAYK
jgi:hypothetical protein